MPYKAGEQLEINIQTFHTHNYNIPHSLPNKNSVEVTAQWTREQFSYSLLCLLAVYNSMRSNV